MSTNRAHSPVYGMFALLLLLLLAKDDAYGAGFSDVLVSFIIDATPVVYAPVRLAVHTCNDQDDTIRLSRQLSRSHLAHEIRDSFLDWDQKAPDHRSLRVLDLQCDYSLRILQKANSSGMFIAPAKWLLFVDKRDPIDSLTSTGVDKELAIFKDLNIYPDSDVLVVSRVRQDFLSLTSIYRTSPGGALIIEDRGNWSTTGGLRLRTLDVASRRRRNLHRASLKACLVMTDPNTINHLTDYEDKHVDGTTKLMYSWQVQIAHRINATVAFNVSNTWGSRDKNGSWNGMLGMLERDDFHLGSTAFIISERIGPFQYIPLFVRTRSRFIFRQPLLSSISNIFILPFQRSVWIATGTFLLLVFALLYLSTKWEYYRGASANTADYWEQFNPADPTLSDNFLVVLGAVAQQGYSYEPYRVPSRIVTLMLLIAALSLYTSYTANIVALLQSTTDAIKTPVDLLKSPLELGSQDVVYNRHYFKAFQDPTRKAIYEQKIEPKGRKSSWMSIQEGVGRIRSGLFAFHGETGIVYKLMQETFHEGEKCGITEIDYLNVLDPFLIIKARSPYLEIIKNAALLLHETGLKHRDEKRFFTEKPKCNGGMGFVSIGLTECHFAFVTMGYGLLLTLVVLLGEFLWFKWRKNSVEDIGKSSTSLDFMDDEGE